MKTIFSLLVFGCAAANLMAQVYLAGGQPNPVRVAVPAVVYSAPVVYQAPVVYEGPVVYRAPVYYATPVLPPEPILVESSVPACRRASPNVVYFGGPNSDYHNATAGSGYNSCSPVIYFGRGESYQRGYQFQHPR